MWESQLRVALLAINRRRHQRRNDARSLVARFFPPIRSDPHQVAAGTTEVQMNAAVPVKWRHHDFANVLAMRTLLADTFIGFRTGGILIAQRYSRRALYRDSVAPKKLVRLSVALS